jgi:alkaline phosphatase D
MFTLGVASGDPSARSVVLWTRLAPDPLNGGGLGQRVVPVTWKVATDPHMRHVIRQGVALARPRHGHAVRPVARGLPSDCTVWYQFHALGQSSRIGRTKTFPSRRQRAHRLRLALVSCQNYEQGFYPAFRDIAHQDLDCVIHVGDYIYEGGASSSPLLPGRVHNSAEIVSVDEYRDRYAQYRLDPDLQDAHACHPFICTWDDHEVDNNYAGSIPEGPQPMNADFIQRRSNAYQVYAETMPLRPLNRLGQRQGGLNLARKLTFGDLADIHVLDTRQFRSDQPAGDGFGSTDTLADADEDLLELVLGESLFDESGINDPAATMLGLRQELWLARNLRRSRARWNILAQQVMQMRWNLKSTVGLTLLDPAIPPSAVAAFQNVTEILNIDAWDGYPAARQRLFSILDALRPNNPVVLTGDIHSSWAGDLLRDFADPTSDVLAAEFVCTAISSTFLAPDPRPTSQIVGFGIPDNPHIKYFDGVFRGYALCDVNRHRWRTEFRRVGTLADLTDPDPLALVPLRGDPVETNAVAEIEAGFNRPGSPKGGIKVL